MKFTIRELLILAILIVFALALPATCGSKVRGQCTPPQYRNTLQHDIHRDGPCEDKEFRLKNLNVEDEDGESDYDSPFRHQPLAARKAFHALVTSKLENK